MVFSSLEFIFIFLPVCLAGYFLIPKSRIRAKNVFLLLMSLLFYAFGEPVFVFMMILSIFVNHAFGIGAEKCRDMAPKRKALLFFMTVFNIGILFIFKYLNFTIFSMNSFLGLSLPQTAFVLPIGISFFTFQAMSYVIDVSRGNADAQRNLLDTALFISLFPALIAGPIIRYRTIAEQLLNRSVSLDDFIYGIKRFMIGFAKKVIFANTFAICADEVFIKYWEYGDMGQNLPALMAWIGAICYTMQIYFDFSGYSDMAIGLGRMFGFRILENFNYPYFSKSITDFWRRWHISLSSWFRDYVYIPLGGSRVDHKSRLVFNLFVTWMLTGVWHGANWTFILWGFFYFVLLTAEKLIGIPRLTEKHPVFGIFYRVFTVLCFVFGWVLFRAESLGQALGYLKAMAGSGFASGIAVLTDPWTEYMWSQYAVILALAVFLATPAPKYLFDKAFGQKTVVSKPLFITEHVLYLGLFFLTLAFMVNSRYNPFIYFNF